MTKFTLCPKWEADAYTLCYPRPPQPIYCGDTVVGHRFYWGRGERPQVQAVGDDHELQAMLEAWFEEHEANERRARDLARHRAAEEERARQRQQVRDARRAVGLE